MPWKPREVLARLQRVGFVIQRKGSGAHLVLRHADGRQTYVAMPAKDMPGGTFRILKQSKPTEEDFRQL